MNGAILNDESFLLKELDKAEYLKLVMLYNKVIAKKESFDRISLEQ